jgi:putative methionine-R-sulfoxide reductase with GAF domain
MLPKLYVMNGAANRGRAFELGKKTLFVGRSSSNDIQINDPTVSRKHLKVYSGSELRMFFIEDLNSTNGTFLRDALIEPGEGFQVDDSDAVTIGKTVLRFQGVPSTDPLNINGGQGQPRHNGGNERDRFQRQKERRSTSPRNPAFISKTAQLFEKTPALDEILDKTLAFLLDALPRVDRAAILLFDKRQRKIRQLLAKARGGEGSGAVHFSKALVKQVLRDGKTIKLSNVRFEYPTAGSKRNGHSHIRSVLCVPVFRNSKIRGGIYLDSHLGPHDKFRKDDHLLLHRVSDLVARSIEKASLLLN